jgi:hypothetical protein
MSCLFNSIGKLLGQNSQVLRNEICDYLEANNKLIDGLDTKDILKLEGRNYVRNMRRTSTWGGAIEIQCACNIWNCRINVVNIREQPQRTIEFVPITGTIEKTLSISWTGGHYEPVSIS